MSLFPPGERYQLHVGARLGVLFAGACMHVGGVDVGALCVGGLGLRMANEDAGVRWQEQRSGFEEKGRSMVGFVSENQRLPSLRLNFWDRSFAAPAAFLPGFSRGRLCFGKFTGGEWIHRTRPQKSRSLLSPRGI